MPEEVKRLVEQFRGRVQSVLEVAEKGDTSSPAFDIFIITHVAAQQSVAPTASPSVARSTNFPPLDGPDHTAESQSVSKLQGKLIPAQSFEEFDSLEKGSAFLQATRSLIELPRDPIRGLSSQATCAAFPLPSSPVSRKLHAR